MATKQDLDAQELDELKASDEMCLLFCAGDLNPQQDWDGSMLGAYLLRDYWSLDGGLRILSGFDYSASLGSAVYQTLDPCTLQGHHGKDADKVEELVNRMSDDLDRLHIIWAGCRRDIEAEDYPPAFFIEWAISKDLQPDWLDWAIERKLYIPKQKADKAPQAGAPVTEMEADTPDKIQATLFNPVTVEALEKMFPAGDKWKCWAERAALNGLKDAREGRARFNPYKAGVWFLTKGITGWDTARLNRTLANNLPTRSRADAHLLTSGID